MIATGGTALRSMVWPSAPSVATSSSWTIFTTIWPGVTDLTTVAPTACSRTRSMKLRTTSSETSASSSARRTSRIAASTSASDSAPRPVSRSRMPPSFSDRLSNNAVVPVQLVPFGDSVAQLVPSSRVGPVRSLILVTPLRGSSETGSPNTFAPEGASRCRALASGLKGRAAGRKERLFENCAGLNAGHARKVKESSAAYGLILPLKHIDNTCDFNEGGHFAGLTRAQIVRHGSIQGSATPYNRSMPLHLFPPIVIPPLCPSPADVFLDGSPASAWPRACRLSGCPRMKTYDGPVSDHFDGLHFFDPDGAPPKSLARGAALAVRRRPAARDLAGLGAERLRRCAAARASTAARFGCRSSVMPAG